MKGLLLKDWYVLWKLGKLYFVMMLVFFALSLNQTGYFYCCFIALLMAILPMTALSMDERCKWSSYAAALPYSPGTIVASKYVLGLILGSVATGLRAATAAVSGAITNSTPEVLFPACLMLSIGFLLMTITYPVMFKFGTEKGRIAYLVTIALVTGIVSAGAIFLQDEAFPAFLNTFVGVPIFVFPIIALILAALSLLLSIQIYKKKEF